MQGHRPTHDIRLTSEGLHLDNSILWFDAAKKGELSFLSSAGIGSDLSESRVISTQETIKILETLRKRPKALICQYNQPFSVGKLTMELLPSGSALGGASLYVETGHKKRILYAPDIQVQKNATVRKYQLRPVNTLIIRASNPDPKTTMPSRRKELERLLQKTAGLIAEGVYPTILCKSMPTAQEITKALSDAEIPLMVHPSIFRINRIYESFGSELGNYSLFHSRKTRQKVALLPIMNRRLWATQAQKSHLYIIEDSTTNSQPESFFTKVAERFYISSTANGRDILEVINATGPEEIYIYGPYTKRYVEMLRNEVSASILPLYAGNQDPLF